MLLKSFLYIDPVYTDASAAKNYDLRLNPNAVQVAVMKGKMMQ
jgi:hypothetical protein